MWTDGEVFRSYGAQKADLKGVDFFFFSASFLLADALSHEGCPGSFFPGMDALCPKCRRMGFGARKSWLWTFMSHL